MRRGSIVSPCVVLATGCARIALAALTLGASMTLAESSRPGLADALIEEQLEESLVLYRDLHRHPELSLHERETAARVARALAAAGYVVQTGIGGHGVVGVLENGDGPTVLLRGDMDALPVTEETGLEYASRVRQVREDGSEVGVMHACGHDIHTANLVGTAKLLARARARWRGTLVILAQPAEELGRGARAMMSDGLWLRVPRPDYTVALHVEPEVPAGSVGLTSGWAFANVDAVDVHIHGRGGHGARPHQAIDPIVTSAHFITALQTVVSRRLDPQRSGVITVGSIHAGFKHNVIPDEAHMQLTVRSYSDETRALLLEGIRQIAEDTCRTFQCPKPPEVETREHYTPAVYNDPELTTRARRVFARLLGKEGVMDRPPSMGGEDFGRYSRDLGVPGLLYRLGAVSQARWADHLRGEGEPLPSLHSSRFAPDPEPTLRTGMRSMSALALELLAPSDPPGSTDAASGVDGG